MPRIAFRLLLALSLALPAAGCGPRAPMTDSEFLGFCSQGGGRRGGCDAVALCGEYLDAVGKPLPDREACMAGCEEVRKRHDASRPGSSCAGVYKSGADWCQRYCRTLFP